MAEPKKPFHVSFQTGQIPKSVDHSRSNPGPSTAGTDRAGYTSVKQRARVTFTWDNGRPRKDGMVPFFARSAEVFFWLDDFIVAVSSDYPAGSCAFNATRRHEFESHVQQPIKIFNSYRETLVTRLNAILLPTEQAPLWLRPEGLASKQAQLESQVAQVVGTLKQQLVQALRADRDSQDSPQSYKVVYDSCSPQDWIRGKGR